LLVRDQPPWAGLREAARELSPNRSRPAAEVRVLGALAVQWALGRPECYAIPHALPWLQLGETVYRDPVSPRAMTRGASACLAATRSAAGREAATRRVNATALLEAIGSASRVRSIRPLPGAAPGYLRLPLRLAQGLAGFPQLAAATRLGFARTYPSILPAIPQVRPWVDDATTGWPGAEELVRTLCTAPTHSLLTSEERAALIQHLQAYERGA
jgi:hypothetical protein